ncbi:hypothetical protein [Mesorhizobium sophorae]|uniref:hypothetical protein n=1 Tax=Mesorhizobium sophorae TaxID=1300294 RepID=UPI000BA4D780|nr:hypothetical protein [Mesorhizobium sophorae]
MRNAELRFNFDKTVFDDMLRVIKETRNELFHSKPIKDRKKVVEACERMRFSSISATMTPN